MALSDWPGFFGEVEQLEDPGTASREVGGKEQRGARCLLSVCGSQPPDLLRVRWRESTVDFGKLAGKVGGKEDHWQRELDDLSRSRWCGGEESVEGSGRGYWDATQEIG